MRKTFKRLLAYILTAAFILQGLSALSLIAHGESTGGGGENLLLNTQVSSRGVEVNINGNYGRETTRPFVSNIGLLTDGNTTQHIDFPFADDWRYGVEYTLHALAYVDRLTIFAAIQAAPTDAFRVYASAAKEGLYKPDNIVADNVQVSYSASTDVKIGDEVQYVAIVGMGGDTRPKEFQLWTPDPSQFTPKNLLRTNLKESKSVSMNAASSAVQDSSRYSEAALKAAVDGDKGTPFDVYGADGWYSGALFTLDGPYQVEKAVIYAGIGENYPESYRVYASDDLETLYTEANMLGDNIAFGVSSKQELAVGRRVRYLAVFTTTWTGNARPKEFQLWSGEEPDGPVLENLFRRQDGTNVIASSYGIVMSKADSKKVERKSRFVDGEETALSKLIDGDQAAAADLRGAETGDGFADPKYPGVCYELNALYMVERLDIYAGFSNMTDTYRVYASDSLSTLYTKESLITKEDLVCDGTVQKASIGKKIQYVAVVMTAFDMYNGRMKELELHGYDNQPDGQVLENLFRRQDGANVIASSYGIVMSKADSKNVERKSRFVDGEETALSKLIDGDQAAAADLRGAETGDGFADPKYPGVCYELNALYMVERLDIYAGFSNMTDTYRVYASDSLSTLYTKESLITKEDLVCDGTVQKASIGKKIQYVAVVMTAFDMYNGRMKELELYGYAEEDPDGFKSENLLCKPSTTGVAIAVNIQGKYGKEKPDTPVNALTDGDLTKGNDFGTSTDWYYGVKYVLAETCYVERLRLYSGLKDLPPDTYRVYASEELVTDNKSLYQDANIVANDLQVTHESSVDVLLNRKVRCIAIVGLATSGNSRPREIELWSGKETGENPPVTDTSKKVLTIGNSFSENASMYAAEIAAAQGFDLTFAYLKYPSCTIAQHWENAQKENAVYKFAVRTASGATVVKDGSSTFATIKEALEYKDWDIVVLQQGSTASHDYAQYARLGDLIGYVKGVCPDAELMLHETWSWDSWDAARFDAIEAAYHKAAAEFAGDGGELAVIHSGRAFELAREALNDRTILNENDHQHANTYGQFVAGASYVTAIFGCDITENTFGNGHPYFKDIDMPTLRQAVMDAPGYTPEKPAITWPEAPAGDNLFTNAAASTILAPNGEYAQSAERGYTMTGDLSALADGNITDHYDVYGFGENDRPGVMYDLGALYDLSHIRGWAGINGNPQYRICGYRVYAAEQRGDLFKDESLVFQYSNEDDTTSMFAFEPEEGTLSQIRYVAIFVTDSPGGGWRLREFAAYGEKSAEQPGPVDPVDPDPPVKWPEVSAGTNLFAGASASPIVAPEGRYADSALRQYTFVNGQDKAPLSALADGNLEVHYDVYGIGGTDKPGVLYDLGAYYDLSQIAGWAGIYQSTSYVNYGYRVYAAEKRDDLFKDQSLAFQYSNAKDTTSRFVYNPEAGRLNKIRYVAVFVTDSSDGSWRLREFAAYGSKSADQTGPVDPVGPDKPVEWPALSTGTNLFAGASASPIVAPEGKYADSALRQYTFVNGQDKAPLSALADGNLEVHYDVYGIGSADKPGVLYDLGAYYDLSQIAGWAGIYESLTYYNYGYRVYAAELRENLFKDESLAYQYSNAKDTSSRFVYNAQAGKLNKIRYVAVFVTDSSDGGWRLREFAAYGSKSADQTGPAEPETPVGPVEWPALSTGTNLFASAAMTPVVAPEGRYADSAYYLYTFVNGPDAAKLTALADGNTQAHYDVYSIGEKDRPGVLFDLGAYYNLSQIAGWAGIYESFDYVNYGYRVYASERRADLFKDSSLAFQYSNAKDTSSRFVYNVEDGTLGKIRYVAIFLTGSSDGGWRMREFAAYGSKSADQTVPDEPDIPGDPTVNPNAYVKKWPAAPAGSNLFASAKAATILAPGGDFAGGKEYAYSFMDGQDPGNLSKLTDGDLTKHFDAYGFGANDKPGILFDLGAYYDISQIRGWAGICDSDMYYNYGYRVYASDNPADLYKTRSLVFNYADKNDVSGMFATDIPLTRIRYIAIFLTGSSDGGWRLREFAAYGSKSADQSEPEIAASLIEGIDAEYYGVAKEDLADPVYAGASAVVGALTDGRRDGVEFWGGSDIQNTRFVFIYDLYANYDLTGAAIYAAADAMDLDNNVHKGIKSAKIYAASNFPSLFDEANAVTVKEGYEDEARADETSFYEAQAPAGWKSARYVAFVFTIGDSAYGACRLEELQVFGELSVTQIEEEKPPRLAQYIDVTSSNNVVMRLFQKNGNDNLELLKAILHVSLSQEAAELEPVKQKLGAGFGVDRLYSLRLTDDNNKDLPLDGRIIRLSFPADDADWQIACVDDYGAEVVSSGRLNGAYTVETETLRSYAMVKSVDEMNTDTVPVMQTPAALWFTAVALGALAIGGTAFMTTVIVRSKKK